MSTITVSDFPLEVTSPAQRLRRLAAAVRVHFTSGSWLVFGLALAVAIALSVYAGDIRSRKSKP